MAQLISALILKKQKYEPNHNIVVAISGFYAKIPGANHSPCCSRGCGVFLF